MCVIIFRPVGKAVSDEMLLAAGRQNSDGVGIMWCKDGKIHTRRSLDPTAALKMMHGAPDDVDVAIHFRWATHGTKTKNNCHPFRVVDDLYMMHNGVLAIADPDKILSDTATYARRVLRPILEQSPEVIMNERFRLLVDMSAGSSNKLVFVRNDGASGEWFFVNQNLGTWSKDDGCWYSSHVNKYVSTKAKTTTTGYYGGGEGSYVWDAATGELVGTDDFSRYKYNGARARAKASDTVGGSEDTLPFGSGSTGTTGGERPDDAAAYRDRLEEMALERELDPEAGADPDRAYAEDRDVATDRERSESDLQAQLAEARATWETFKGDLEVPEEELSEYLLAEFGYDTRSDRLVGSAA